MPAKEDAWLSPIGASETDWAKMERYLDGEVTLPEEEVTCTVSEDAYWGKGLSAHFWGPTENPVRRPIAAVIPASGDWKSAPPSGWQEQAKQQKKKMYSERLNEKAWPSGPPAPISSSRVLGTVKTPSEQTNVVSGEMVFKGMFIAPLNSGAKEEIKKSAQTTLQKSLGTSISINSLFSTPQGARLLFHAFTDRKKADPASYQKTITAMAISDILSCYDKFGVKPKNINLDTSRCKVVSRKKIYARGSPAHGATSMEEDQFTALTTASARYVAPAKVGTSSTKTAAGGYSSLSSSVGGGLGSALAETVASQTVTNRVNTAAALFKQGGHKDKKLTANEQRFASTVLDAANLSLKPQPKTLADKRKLLLGKVMNKAKQQVMQVESDHPQIPSSHAKAQAMSSPKAARAPVLESEKIKDINAAIVEARNTLTPPSEWKGALRRTEFGRRTFENFELNLVSHSKETRQMIGTARVQNGKIDVTYQAKMRAMSKDGNLVLELVLDNGGVCKGAFNRRGVIEGTFKFPNGEGSFKLQRYIIED
eukprot:TRINITY_DN7622_c0_g1_i1.p1 TRINITY_DN7622_c0_g1~~TRINITY_DN7622_c0_g1_i1.p1  ORF type:complete len:538 (+),score=121.13 TRINITY_DN7622_c0_g1_i1:70-1683(+)